jgi:hypothetical protein
VNLTERFAKSAAVEGRKSPIFYDDEVIGFGVQVRDNGRKTFTGLHLRRTPPTVFYRRLSGLERRFRRGEAS